MIQSELLSREIVVVARDQDSLKNIPDSAKHYRVYLFEEVTALGGSTDNEIRQAHAVKRVFDGEIEAGQESTRQPTGKHAVGPTRTTVTQ